NEAPPAVISIFLGDELNAVVEALENDAPYEGARHMVMKLGANVLPDLRKDSTDRNRTSPFAFTGNKFEFRMLGSSNSISCANIHLNAAVAESLRQFADVLENADDLDKAIHDLIRENIKAHKRIIFNGNGYDDSWIAEAEKRGLANLRTTADCMPKICDKKNVEMLTRHAIFTEAEITSRRDIMLENYVKTVNIEANTMLDMARTQILPAISAFASGKAAGVVSVLSAVPGAHCEYEKRIVERLSQITDEMDKTVDVLDSKVAKLRAIEDIVKQSEFVRDSVIPAMEDLRALADEAETMVAKESWPFPTYDKLLFGV
ncbi:MAG: glutamine synthetase type III, partial [Oscillospiraceae bacterium]|nr:glutamine synthetase type III [Oscillospiraceae bacterium]